MAILVTFGDGFQQPEEESCSRFERLMPETTTLGEVKEILGQWAGGARGRYAGRYVGLVGIVGLLGWWRYLYMYSWVGGEGALLGCKIWGSRSFDNLDVSAWFVSELCLIFWVFVFGGQFAFECNDGY